MACVYVILVSLVSLVESSFLLQEQERPASVYSDAQQVVSHNALPSMRNPVHRLLTDALELVPILVLKIVRQLQM